MRLFLRLKHWQLFMITWACACAVVLIGIFELGLALSLMPVVLITGSIGFFGWVSSIGVILHQYLPKEVDMNLRLFKLAFLIPIVFMFCLITWIMLNYFNILPGILELSATTIATIIFPLHLISLVIISWAIIFASKVIKSVELQRLATFEEYALEFFQIWFSIIGLWYLQPRLNKMIK